MQKNIAKLCNKLYNSVTGGDILKKIRILHTGDLHLDTVFFTTENKADILKYELLESFAKITRIAKEKNVDAMVIAGDITDNGVLSKASYDFFYNQLYELDIPVVIILGNHDYGFNYALPQNVTLLEQFGKVSIGEADIYGASFDYGNVIENFKADNSSKINIMVFHGTVGGNTDNPVSVSQIEKSGLDYIALGHIHKFDGLKKSGDTSYAYCGVPFGRGFDEQGQKGVIVADVEKGNVKIEYIPVAKRQYIEQKIDVTGCESYINVMEKLEGFDKENLYKFVLTGTPSGYIDFKGLNAVINDRFFYGKVVDETENKVDITSISEEESLRGYFINNIISNGGNDSAIKYGLSALKGERIYVDED